jgi:hypothetical protein
MVDQGSTDAVERSYKIAWVTTTTQKAKILDIWRFIMAFSERDPSRLFHEPNAEQKY